MTFFLPAAKRERNSKRWKPQEIELQGKITHFHVEKRGGGRGGGKSSVGQRARGGGGGRRGSILCGRKNERDGERHLLVLGLLKGKEESAFSLFLGWQDWQKREVDRKGSGTARGRREDQGLSPSSLSRRGGGENREPFSDSRDQRRKDCASSGALGLKGNENVPGKKKNQSTLSPSLRAGRMRSTAIYWAERGGATSPFLWKEQRLNLRRQREKEPASHWETVLLIRSSHRKKNNMKFFSLSFHGGPGAGNKFTVTTREETRAARFLSSLPSALNGRRPDLMRKPWFFFPSGKGKTAQAGVHLVRGRKGRA